jgi:dolichol-phosphate mannosyltransferase
VIDADLQDPPELLPAMLERLNAGCDVVYGQRAKREGETLFKKVSAALFYRLLKQLVDIDVPLDAGDFRLMSRRALDVLNSMPEQQRFIRGMVSWIGFRQEAFRYDRAARFAGETKYPFSKMLRLALDAITGFSVRPLRLASYLGFMSGMAGLLLLIYTFVSWYHGGTVRGWTSLTAIVLVVSSAQLIVAGVTGEYLGRLYMESKRRPLFVIEDIVRGEQVRRTTSAPKRGERAAEASGA